MRAQTNYIGTKTGWSGSRSSPVLENAVKRAFDILKVPRDFAFAQASENVQFYLFDAESKNVTVHEFLGKECGLRSVRNGNNRFATVFVCLDVVNNGFY
ncbi:hypothetical protein MHBO_000696 [Bonamia ostreae]|uniref:Uncharacterized protein n=1 Tax=Bonamia ostreae TaxID=126728 RepID=A0ABV2AGQ7_9EUKA